MGLYSEINQRINDFISKPENSALQAGTGISCIPFRGPVLGSYRAEEVEDKIARGERLDVLWLGANPNAPESVAHIVGEVKSYEDHLGSFNRLFVDGWACEVSMVNGQQKIWDPLSNVSQSGWKFLREVVVELAGGENVAFANIVPWGSKTTNELIRKLREFDPALLMRILAFSDELMQFIICELNPRVVLAPKSLCMNSFVRKNMDSPVFGGRSYPHDTHSFKPGKTRIIIHTRYDEPSERLYVYAAHPSALRVKREFRDKNRYEMLGALRNYL